MAKRDPSTGEKQCDKCDAWRFANELVWGLCENCYWRETAKIEEAER